MVANVGSAEPAVGSFAELMRQTRQNRRLSQQEVGDIVGVTAITVSRWENGHSGKVQARLRPIVANFLGLPTRDLYRVLGLQGPTSNVVTMFGDTAPASGTAPSAPLGTHAPTPSHRVGASLRTVITAIAARIGTGVPLSDDEMRFHERLLAEARLADATESPDS